MPKGRTTGCLHQILILQPDKEDRVVLVVKPTETGTIFQASNDSRCSYQPTHVQSAHDEADLLCSSEGHCSPCIGLFSLGSLFLWWELVETFPSSSTKEPHSGLSKQYEVGRHTSTGEMIAPPEPETHSVLAKALTILLRLWRTARSPLLATTNLSVIQSTTSPMSILALM